MEYTMAYFDRVRGARRRREIVDDDMKRTIVTVFLKDANYAETASLMQATRQHAREHLAPRGGRIEFAGDVAVSQAMIPAIVRTQLRSLVVALASALAAISLLLRSVRHGVLAVLPATLAALWVLGAMGWLGIPLGVATSMFCAISLGIGVDYAIHVLEAVRRARATGLADPVRAGLAEVAPAIVTDALAVGLGFGLLGLSRVPPNAHLGLLVALVLACACVLTLVGLGSLLRIGQRERA
jgi:predicted RND superfamily exporter protein